MTDAPELPPDPVHRGDAARWGGWSWQKPIRGEHFRRCSYCGSVHPGDLVAEPTWHADWADMKYGWPHKFYVDVPNRNPETLFVIGSQHGGGPAERPPAESGGLQWVAWPDLTTEQLMIAHRDGFDDDRPPRYVGFGTRPVHHAKFYTVHLAAAGDSTRSALEQGCGLRFEFTAGSVEWRSAQ